MRLDDYVETALRKRFRWGSFDCCCFAFDWVQLRREVDPMAPWRGKYSDKATAIRQFAKAGGLDAVIEARMDALGFERTDKPEAGDVGIILAPTSVRGRAPILGPVAAICYGPRWLALMEDGIAGGPFEVKAAWSV